jgi:hypothetical protein
MAPYNSLAMQLIRDRKATIAARVASGEITREQGSSQYREFVADMMQRRGQEPKPDKPT